MVALTATGCTHGTVKVALPNAAGAAQERCAQLVDHLPALLDGRSSRVVEPRSPLVHAWGSPPIVMRCGVPRPASFNPASPQTTLVNGVTWFQQIGSTTIVWTAILKDINVELRIPTSYDSQGGFLVELSTALKYVA